MSLGYEHAEGCETYYSHDHFWGINSQYVIHLSMAAHKRCLSILYRMKVYHVCKVNMCPFSHAYTSRVIKQGMFAACVYSAIIETNMDVPCRTTAFVNLDVRLDNDV